MPDTLSPEIADQLSRHPAAQTSDKAGRSEASVALLDGAAVVFDSYGFSTRVDGSGLQRVLVIVIDYPRALRLRATARGIVAVWIDDCANVTDARDDKPSPDLVWDTAQGKWFGAFMPAPQPHRREAVEELVAFVLATSAEPPLA